MKKIFNILGFQICWWICVIFSTTNYSYVGPLAMLLYIVLHLLYITDERKELWLVFLVALIGTIFDSIFILIGFFNYSSSFSLFMCLAPLWITAMWAGFATTLNHSLSWINKNYYLAFLMGFIFGPISYLTGRNFEAIEFHVSDTIGLLALAFSWGVIIPLIVIINKNIIR